MKTLVLLANYTGHYSYYDDWLEAFRSAPGLGVEARDLCAPGPVADTREYDLIVLLHSTNADQVHFLAPWIPRLADRGPAKLLSFVGNEYNMPRSHVGMRDKIELLERIRPDIVASQLTAASAGNIYGDLVAAGAVRRVAAIPHAINPERFRPMTPQRERPIDLGVRTASYLPILGDLERNSIVRFFEEARLPAGLKVDSQRGSGRLGPDAWAAFLDSCKGTVATEAGTYYLEKDDRTVRRIARYLAREHPSLLLYGIEKKIGQPWLRARASTVAQAVTATLIRLGLSRGPDAYYQEAVFEELYERFFRDYPNPVSGKCISSRHFDAIGTKTCQIMFPGQFNGILVADRHYIALERDFSNIDDVLERFTDDDYRSRMVDETYEHIMASHTYRHRIEEILELVGSLP